jgi:hypothetical protein
MTTDVEFLGRWFAEVTKPQLARYNERMSDARAYRNTPRWTRERSKAQNEFHATTAEARRLYELAIAEIEAIGEVSEAVDAALTRFQAGAVSNVEAA